MSESLGDSEALELISINAARTSEQTRPSDSSDSIKQLKQEMLHNSTPQITRWTNGQENGVLQFL